MPPSRRVRRAELAALGIQLPVLPTVCPVALPGGAGWAARLERIGLDVITSGADEDDVATWGAAQAAVPHRPAMARCADASTASALVEAGCRIVRTAGAPAGAYRFHEERAVRAIDGHVARIEDIGQVARHVLEAAQAATASELWVTAGEGLADLPEDVVEAKLVALAEGARQARLWLAKEQFDRE